MHAFIYVLFKPDVKIITVCLIGPGMKIAVEIP